MVKKFHTHVLPEITGRIPNLSAQEGEDWEAACKGLETDAAAGQVKGFLQDWDWTGRGYPHGRDFRFWRDRETRRARRETAAHVNRLPGDFAAWPFCSRVRITLRTTGLIRYGWVLRRPVGDELYYWKPDYCKPPKWYRIKVLYEDWDRFDVLPVGDAGNWPSHAGLAPPVDLLALLEKDTGAFCDAPAEVPF